MKKYKLIDKQNRAILGEGRNYGCGFALCRKINDFTFETAYPISPCRDYLNDQVWSEVTGKEYNTYGLHSFKQNLFTDTEGCMAFAICKMGPSTLTEYPLFKRDCDTLEKNYLKLQEFINWFETQFKVEKLTQIIRISENLYVAVGSIFWFTETYKISLYSLLFRTGIFWESGDKIDFIKKFNFDYPDQALLKSALPKIELMLQGTVPKQDMNNLHHPHNVGICGFKF